MLKFFKRFIVKDTSKEEVIINEVIEVPETIEIKEELVESANESPEIKEIVEEARIEPVKRIEFSVKGAFVEERQKKISNLIKVLKSEEYFYEDQYDGLTNKELKEDYYGEKVYQYGGWSLPKGKLIEENDNEYDKNAIKVLITHDDEDIFVGYVPKKLCLEIRQMKEKYDYYVATSVEGGKYKTVVFDEYGDEKVKTFTKEYGIRVCLSFWEVLPDSLSE